MWSRSTWTSTDEERVNYAHLHRLFTTAYAAFRHTLPQATWADFVRAAGRSSEGRRAVAAWREARRLLALTRAKRDTLRSLLDRHGTARVLIFTADNASAYAIAREHLIMPLTCDIGRQERDQVLDAFRQGHAPGARLVTGAQRGPRRARCGRRRHRRGRPGRARARAADRSAASARARQAGPRVRTGYATDPGGQPGLAEAPRACRPTFRSAIGSSGARWCRASSTRRITRGCGRSSRSASGSSDDPSASSTPGCGSPLRRRSRPGRSSSRFGLSHGSARTTRDAAVPPRQAADSCSGRRARSRRARCGTRPRGECAGRHSRGARRVALCRPARRACRDRPRDVAVTDRTGAPGQPRADASPAVPSHRRDPRRPGPCPGARSDRQATWAHLHRLPRRHAATPSSRSRVPSRFSGERSCMDARWAHWCRISPGARDSVCGRRASSRRGSWISTSGRAIPSFRPTRPGSYDSQIEERFAREFRKLAPDWDVFREPGAGRRGNRLVFPDFALQHRYDASRRWLLEIVGFWTPTTSGASSHSTARRVSPT